MSLRRSKGFTLVELMVTVAVLAILSTIAYPSFQSTIRSNRVATGGNEALALVALARSEGVRNKHGGGVCGSSTGSSCDDAWSKGMLAWSDTNGDGIYQSGEPALRFMAVSSGLVGSGPDGALVAFDNRGRLRANATQTVTLQPTECGKVALRRVMKINVAGQVTSQKEDCK